MINKAEFGLYLELSGPGGRERGRLLGVDDDRHEEILRRMSGVLPTVLSPIEAVIDTFGAPDSSDARGLAYDLEIRKDYVYVIRVSPDGSRCLGSGYERRIVRSLDPTLSQRRPVDALRAQLIQLGATETELHSLFGEPEDHTGWWPYETRRYRGGLVVELRLGVVEG